MSTKDVRENSIDDAQLQFNSILDRVRSGSEDAAIQLVEQYGRHVVRAVRRKLNSSLRSKFDSADFVQAVWASFFNNLGSILDLESPKALIAFLARLAHNKVVDEVRRSLLSKRRSVTRELPLNQNGAHRGNLCHMNGPTPSEAAIANETLENLCRNQSVRIREFVRLRCNGMSFAEIARRLNVDEGTVRRVMKRLSKSLES